MFCVMTCNRSTSSTSTFVKLALLAFVITTLSAAQQVTGWTSLEWDPASKTLHGYAETYLDDNAALYYAAALNTYLNDSQGHVIASAVTPRNTDESWVEAEISASGAPGQIYTQNSEHFGIVQYESDCALPCQQGVLYYDDTYNYSYFAGSGDNTDYGGDMLFFGPGPLVHTKQSAPHLPTTHTAATASTQTCGDIRDTMIQEYVTYQVDFQPHCNYFTSGTSSEYLDLPPVLRQTVKTQNSSNGELSQWDCLAGSSRKSSS